MRRHAGRWTRCVGALAALAGVGAGCGGSSSSPPSRALPAHPEQWVCRDATAPASQAAIDAWCAAHPDRGRAVPPDLQNPPPVADFTNYQTYIRRLERFLTTEEFKSLGWTADKHWRFSGPSIDQPSDLSHNYGPHFPLRVYYSPEVVEWLCNGRAGAIPDGAMIVKAMAVAFSSLPIQVASDGCMDIVTDDPDSIAAQLWAPMLKSSRSSYDGWLWTLQQPDLSTLGILPQFPPPLLTASAFTGAVPDMPPGDDPRWLPTGSILQQLGKVPDVVMLAPLTGLPYCLSCHSTAESESTFASMDNILGTELRYKVFAAAPPTIPTPTPASFAPLPTPLPEVPPAFSAFFDQLEPVSFRDVWDTRMPAETYDQQVTSGPDGPGQFLTAAQCNACHNATPQSPLLPHMALVEDPTAEWSPLRDLSPYGEWRVSPMGLAGRDPIFFSQLQSETNTLADHTACIENTSLRCHGVMGARQFASDTGGDGDPRCLEMYAIAPPAEVPFGQPFRRAALQQWPGSDTHDQQVYGALGRDGVSCTVCHHIAAQDLGQEQTFTGNFVTGPADALYGPYASGTVVTKPMQHALGVTPTFGEQIRSSELCGSCHNILLPIFDNAGRRLGSSYEQSTELEWENSTSGRSGAGFRSCQDCHMPTAYAGERLRFKIANSEAPDQFPPTTHRLPDSQIGVRERTHFARHSLHGLNVFLNQFVQQFPLVLGFQQVDWMSEQPSPLDPPALPFNSGYQMVLPLLAGFESMVEMAENDTATVAIAPPQTTADGQLSTVVAVRNLTGHYLPTGVGFRRLILELQVLDAQGAALWASGRTNALGFILDGLTDRVLESEQPVKFPFAPVQPHYQRIDAGAQVQIYQELVRDSDDLLTTSFLRRVHPIKDNRIRPRGFDPRVFARSPSAFVQELAVLPGAEADDPSYTDPSLTGADTIAYDIALGPALLARADRIEVGLYYQSIPPFYLQDRFADASRGPAAQDDIQRLYYLTGHLNVDAVADQSGAPLLSGWKLRVAGAARAVP